MIDGANRSIIKGKGAGRRYDRIEFVPPSAVDVGRRGQQVRSVPYPDMIMAIAGYRNHAPVRR
jgi:hypothetical protein